MRGAVVALADAPCNLFGLRLQQQLQWHLLRPRPLQQRTGSLARDGGRNQPGIGRPQLWQPRHVPCACRWLELVQRIKQHHDPRLQGRSTKQRGEGLLQLVG